MKPWSPLQFSELLWELGRFALAEPGEAQRAREPFVGPDGEVDDAHEGPFMAWLMYGQEDAQGRRALDRFRAQGFKRSRAERLILDALASAWCSLYEVQAVHPGRGLALRDLLTGERLSVKERLATTQLVVFDLLLAWVMPVEGHLELTGAAVRVPRAYRWALVPQLREALARARAQAPDERVHVLQRRLAGELFTRERALRALPRPVLTMDEEPFRPSTAHFRVEDLEAVERGLEEDARFAQDDAHTFSWLDAAGRPELGPGPLVLGLVRLRPTGELVLETNSVERLERGKALLRERFGPALRHQEDHLGEQARVAASVEDAVPETPEERVLFLDALRRYLERLPQLELPEFDGRCPRDIVSLPEGRAWVLEQLKDAEHQHALVRGGGRVDLDAVYQSLGLTRGEEVDLALAYSRPPPEFPPPLKLDASRLPDPPEPRRRARAKPLPEVEPGTHFVFKLGPVPVEGGSINAYLGLEVGQRTPALAFGRKDTEGVEALARRLPAGVQVYCEPRLARAGKRHGFGSRPLPEGVLRLRAALALTMAWGPPEAGGELDLPTPEDIAALLEASVALWEAAPWDYWVNEARLTAELSGAARGERELMLLGNGGEEFGFVLFDAPGSHARMARLARREQIEEASHIPCVALDFDESPGFVADAVEDVTGLPLYPVPLRLEAKGPPGRVSPWELRLLTATAWALGELSPLRREAQGEAGTGEERVHVRVRAPVPYLVEVPPEEEPSQAPKRG